MSSTVVLSTVNDVEPSDIGSAAVSSHSTRSGERKSCSGNLIFPMSLESDYEERKTQSVVACCWGIREEWGPRNFVRKL